MDIFDGEIDCINSGGTWESGTGSCIQGGTYPGPGSGQDDPTGGGVTPGGCPPGTVPGTGTWEGSCIEGTSGAPPVDRGGGGGGGGGDFRMPEWQPFNYNFDFGDAPAFTARRFNAPDPNSILSDPSYKWRLDQSLGALQNSAAARGVARTGNTAKGLIDYAGSAASNEYGAAYDRTARQYEFDYRGDLDEYRPRLITYQTNAAGRQRAMELQAADMWKKYLADLDWSKFLLSADY